MTDATDATEIARRLFAAIEAGDVAAIRASYAPDAQIWHNTDDVTQTFDEAMVQVEWMAANVPGVRYTEPHCSATEDGFVQRHVAVVPLRDGTTLSLRCCVVTKVADGRVTHLWEYFDSVPAAAIGAAIFAG